MTTTTTPTTPLNGLSELATGRNSSAGSAPLASGSGPAGLFDGVKPDWGPFASLGNTGRTLLDVLLAATLFICMGVLIWGIAKQRFGMAGGRSSFHAEEGKGLIVSGLVGIFLAGSVLTFSTIVYGLAI